MFDVLKEAGEFMELTNRLKAIGYKKKEIAMHLEMHAPVFSSLVQTVLPQIVSIDKYSRRRNKNGIFACEQSFPG